MQELLSHMYNWNSLTSGELGRMALRTATSGSLTVPQSPYVGSLHLRRWKNARLRRRTYRDAAVADGVYQKHMAGDSFGGEGGGDIADEALEDLFT